MIKTLLIFEQWIHCDFEKL